MRHKVLQNTLLVARFLFLVFGRRASEIAAVLLACLLKPYSRCGRVSRRLQKNSVVSASLSAREAKGALPLAFPDTRNLCHIPSDLRHLKTTTSGSSFSAKALPLQAINPVALFCDPGNILLEGLGRLCHSNGFIWFF